MLGSQAEAALKTIEDITNRNKSLTETIATLEKKVSFTGLTSDELQSIHELIQEQIKVISKRQNDSGGDEVCRLIEALASLVSLVSRPID